MTIYLQIHGEPCIYSDSWVERYNKKGISVCALDNQSHGRSEGAQGLRCYAENFQDFVDDVVDFARYALFARQYFYHVLWMLWYHQFLLGQN